VLVTDMAEVTLMEKNILRVRLLVDDEISLEMIMKHKVQVNEFLGPNHRCGVLLDTRDVSLYRIKPEVMSFQADNEFSEFQTGMAVLVNNRLVKQLFTTYNLIYKPTVITRVFRDEASAIDWLMSL
jgi:hypothetical protein